MKTICYLTRCTTVVLLLTCIFAHEADASKKRAKRRHAAPDTSYLVQINGQTFQERNPYLRRPPASLTKIMTALIVIENCKMDEMVTVSRAAARETGSRIGLRRGDRFTVHDLLAATLMASANDACRALADHVGGSEQAFVKQMNSRATALKLKNTRFTNACGHDNAGLYSCASDLAILAEHALRNPLFADLVSRKYSWIRTQNTGRTFLLKNKNRLIGRYPGARGVKTGTTPGAGQCLVALAQRGDRRVLLVLMHSRNRWRAAPALLDAAFGTRSSAFMVNAAFGVQSSAMRN